jgi:hypothetical protein
VSLGGSVGSSPPAGSLGVSSEPVESGSGAPLSLPGSVVSELAPPDEESPGGAGSPAGAALAGGAWLEPSSAPWESDGSVEGSPPGDAGAEAGPSPALSAPASGAGAEGPGPAASPVFGGAPGPGAGTSRGSGVRSPRGPSGGAGAVSLARGGLELAPWSWVTGAVANLAWRA